MKTRVSLCCLILVIIVLLSSVTYRYYKFKIDKLEPIKGTIMLALVLVFLLCNREFSLIYHVGAFCNQKQPSLKRVPVSVKYYE